MKSLFSFFLFFITIAVFAGNEPINSNARLQSVTVYTAGAEMNHLATANLKQGTNTLVIEQLSSAIDLNSVQVKVNGAVTILGTEFSNNYLVGEGKNPKVKHIEDSIATLEKLVSKYTLTINNDSGLLEVLKANREIKGTQTGLSVAELIKMMDYYKAKSLELQSEIAQLIEKRGLLKDRVDTLDNQLEDEKQKNTTTTGRLVLQLLVADAGKYDFEMSYIATNAKWYPFYDIRVDDIKNPINLIYKANISQETGLDWKQVKLTLSTATPGQSKKAPELSPWFLSYKYQAYAKGMMSAMPNADNKNLQEVVVVGYGALKRTSRKVNKLEDHVKVSDNILSLTFDVDIPYDIPTNGKEQMVVLKTYTIPANYKHFAIPKLDKDVYIMAQITNWEQFNLLPGDANVIFENTYTGKTFLDPNGIQDTLNLTLGRDKRIAVKRDKLVDFSSVKFLGSNKLQRFTYETTIKNNKKQAINLDLKDQFPLSTNKEIEVELIDANDATINNDTGLLNWQLNIPAGESKKVKFTYTIKYPKDKAINLN